jgi:alpha-2-macroglobulin
MNKFLLLGVSLTLSLGFNVFYLFRSDTPSEKTDQIAQQESAGIKKITYEHKADKSLLKLSFQTAMSEDVLPLTVIPPVKYKVLWQSPMKLQLEFQEALTPGKKYFVKPRETLVDSKGRKLPKEFKKFFSHSLKVIHSSIKSTKENEALVQLRFNGKVSEDSLRKNLSFLGKDNSENKYTLVRAYEDSFVLAVRTGKEKILSLKIDKNLTANQAERSLGIDFRKDLELDKVLKVTFLKSYSNRYGFELRLHLNRDINFDKLSEKLQLSPPLKVSFEKGYDGQIRIKGKFQAATEYKLTLLKGLRAKDDSELTADVSRAVFTGAAQKDLSFLSKGPFFPAGRQFRIPLKVSGYRKIELKLTRVFPNNIVQFLQNGHYSARRVGETVLEKIVDTEVGANETKKIYLDLGENLKHSKGIYILSVKAEGSWQQRQCTLIRSDLGFSLAQTSESLQVWTLNLNNGQAAGHSNVELLSSTNQSLAVKETDGQGLVTFSLKNLAEKAYVVKVSKGDDVAYRELNSAINLSAFQLPHRSFSQKEYEAHVFAERGACRPGETMDFSVILRDKLKQATGGFPLEFVLRGPDNREVLKKLLPVPASGFFSKKIKLNKSARTGYYSFEVRLPGEAMALGKTSFLVNTYTPDTFTVKLSDIKEILLGLDIPVKVEALYNFGGGVANGKVTLNYDYVNSDFSYKNFTFGGKSRRLNWSSSQSLKLDASGRMESIIKLKSGLKPSALGQLEVKATVTDSTGHSISHKQVYRHMAYPYLLGVVKTEENQHEVGFEWIRLNAFREPVKSSDKISWKLIRNKWHYAYKENSEGSYVWKWTCEKDEIKAGALQSLATGGFLNVELLAQGNYELILSAQNDHIRTVLPFNIGQNSDDIRLGNSEFVKIYSDKKLYHVGDTVRLRFESPTDGQALIRLSDNTLFGQQLKTVHRGWNTINLSVPKTNEGSLYVSLTLVRDLSLNLPLPVRFFGLLKLSVNKQSQHLQVKLDSPSKVEPGQQVKLTVGTSQNKKSWVKLMAVDSGVLSLTSYQSPDPFKYFYKERATTAKFFDVFDNMFPELDEKFGIVSLTGGGGEFKSFKAADMDVQKSHVVTLAIVETDEQGQATFEFKAPDFNGSMRLMAVAVNDDSFGSGESSLIVRDKLTIMTSSVKSLAMDDELLLPVKLFNNQTRDLFGGLSFSIEGPAQISSVQNQKLTLKPLEKSQIFVKVKALSKPGKVTLKINFQSEGLKVSKEVKFLVRPTSARLSVGHSGKVLSGEKKSLNLDGKWLAGTLKSTLFVSTSSATEMYTYFKQLQDYPYGCLEQTTSRAFVNLFAAELAPQAEQNLSKDIVLVALDRLALMQRYGGGFSMWPNGRATWLSASIYAAHFIAECKTRKVTIYSDQMSQVVQFLKSTVRNQNNASPEDRAYAMYILASLDKLPVQTAVSMIESDHSVLAKILACGALSRVGKNSKAAEFLQNLNLKSLTKDKMNWDMDTERRRLGLAALVALEIFGESPKSNSLYSQLLSSLRGKTWLSTQDKALLCLVAGQRSLLANESAAAQASVHYSTQKKLVSYLKPLLLQNSSSMNFPVIQNSKKGPVFYSYFASGIPLEKKASESVGLSVKRQYLNERGERQSLFKVGDLVKVKITIKAESDLKDTVILDLLPGCLAIESAYLKSRNGSFEVHGGRLKHYEGLDDRMIICADLNRDQEASFIYTTRVIAAGKFQICGLSAEGMYKPEIRASSNSTKVLEIDETL